MVGCQDGHSTEVKLNVTVAVTCTAGYKCSGQVQTWILDSGMDHGLDYGLNYGLDFGLDSVLVLPFKVGMK